MQHRINTGVTEMCLSPPWKANGAGPFFASLSGSASSCSKIRENRGKIKNGVNGRRTENVRQFANINKRKVHGRSKNKETTRKGEK